MVSSVGMHRMSQFSLNLSLPSLHPEHPLPLSAARRAAPLRKLGEATRLHPPHTWDTLEKETRCQGGPTREASYSAPGAADHGKERRPQFKVFIQPFTTIPN